VGETLHGPEKLAGFSENLDIIVVKFKFAYLEQKETHTMAPLDIGNRELMAKRPFHMQFLEVGQVLLDVSHHD
jgi:hypothetical protein